jgi:hypothetical protein
VTEIPPKSAPDENPAAPGPDSEEGSSPYQNLWVPLIIVPAGIVIALVLVFSMFGLISGEEKSLSENLARVVSGGANERTQALWNLARQVDENDRSLRDGSDLPWPMEEGFLDQVRSAMAEMDEDEYETRLTLAVLLVTLGDKTGVDVLLALLQLTDDEDPDRKLRFSALVNLGQIGDERALPRVLELILHSDAGIRALSAVALQNLQGDGVQAALEGALEDDDWVVRGNAAVSLGKLNPAHERASDILWDMLDAERYSAEHERDPKRYRRGEDISRSRVQAAKVLAGMTVEGTRERLEALREDPDLGLREAALRALEN